MLLGRHDKLRCTPEVLSRVLDGEAVLLHLGSGTYFGTNEVGSRAWELIVAGTTFAELTAKLLEEFDVEPAQLDGDLRDFLGVLIERNLVLIEPPPRPAP